MHAPGCPALSTVALAVRQSRVRATRHHHHRLLPYRAVAAAASRPLSSFPKTPNDDSAAERPSNNANGANGETNGPPDEVKPPPGEALSEHSREHNAADREGAPAASTTSETVTGGRTKRQEAAGATKGRLARKQDSAHLPPVELPPFWQQQHVYNFDVYQSPRLPTAIALEDRLGNVVSRLSARKDGDTSRSLAFFERVVTEMIPEQRLLLDHALPAVSSWGAGDAVGWYDLLHYVPRMIRASERFLDAAWHVADAIAPAKQPEYVYKTRPFWWWHLREDIEARSENAVGARFQRIYDAGLDYSLAHAIPGLPYLPVYSLSQAVGQSIETKAPPSFDPKSGQRPINILVMTGYSGKAVAESIGIHIGSSNMANCVHVDAQDLSVIVGGYLGQTLAYSRGSLSTMGFRAAEANGKLAVDKDSPPRRDDDDDGPEGTSVINVRTTSLEDELQKIRQGNFDLFSKWDRLKIDNALKTVINAGNERHPGPAVVIHVHDYVELSMTMEGSFILSRLRALVDAEWARGRKISILGTSSVSEPSEEFQNMVRDLSANDLVVSRHVQLERQHDARGTRKHMLLDLERLDTFVQNANNIERVLWAMDPNLSKANRVPLYLDPSFASTYGLNPKKTFLREHILPLPEVLDLASAIIHAIQKGQTVGKGQDFFTWHRHVRPLRQGPEESEKGGQKNFNEESSSDESNASKMSSIEASLDQYEKRIAVGWVTRDKVKTTFSDVHAPQETVSALKLLTSLTLTRPDAFQYGILAKNRITGCVLYGPPGTGKTMLAKAVAHDTGANMLEISGASINDKWVGESEKLIRAVFTLAKKLSPCVVFIDEADAILASRSSPKRANHRELINQFLKEWDGIQETTAFIMVATNRPWDLDDAVLRRLPRKILVDLPLHDDRAAILKLLLRDEQLEADVSIDDLANRTPWYSGSDLKAVCVTAAMSAVEEEKPLPATEEGGEPVYPERRTLRREHFERALAQIPASINEDMDSLKHIRKFDQEYGSNRKKPRRKGMGFGGPPKVKDADAQKIRPVAA